MFLINSSSTNSLQIMNTRISLLSLIWLIFTLIFSTLAVMSFSQASKRISALELTARPMASRASVQVMGMDIDKPLADFIFEFNSYIENYNKSAKLQNLFAAWGYVAAGLVSLVSLALSEGWIK